MPIDTVTILSRVPLFAGFERGVLERLARSFKERTFREGHEITTEGEPGVGFFVIVDGSVTVSVGGQQVSTLGPGDSFGEMALIDDSPRSATIVTAEPTRCLALSAWEFRPFVEEHPQIAWSLLQTLARRLRAAQS
jgi:CRP-like cAMP-binding protein